MMPSSTPNTTLRAMTAMDLPAVLAIEVQAYGHPWTEGNFIDSLAAGYLAQVLEPVRDRAGSVRAAVPLLGYCVAMQGVDELHLLNITVAPDFQGQGHGLRLLDAVQAQGRGLGLATLWLEVRRGNERALALYRRHGFIEAGIRRDYYPAAAGREDAVVMRRALDGAAQGAAA